MSWNAIALVVEPPLPVANTLLEEARRLQGRLDEERGSEAGSGAIVNWIRPHRYAAPLAVTEPLQTPGRDHAAACLLDSVPRVLELLLRTREEFAVQMGPLALEPCGDGAVIASRLASARPEDLISFLQEVAPRLGEFGMRGVDVGMVRIPLGRVSGEGSEAVRACLEPKDTPVAGWLLGGVCLARAVVDPEAGLLEAERIRFLPLKRLGSRRSGGKAPSDP